MRFQGPQPRLIRKNQRNPELLSMLSSKLLKNCFYSDNYAFLGLFLFYFLYYLRLRSPSRQQTNAIILDQPTTSVVQAENRKQI